MSGKLATLVVLGAAVVVGAFFFRVVQPFVLPLVLAAVLCVLFWPIHRWVIRLCRGHERIAAGITTVVILTAVLLPIGGGLTLAGLQIVRSSQRVTDSLNLAEKTEEWIDVRPRSAWSDWNAWLAERFSQEQLSRMRQAASNVLLNAAQALYRRTTHFVADLLSFLIGLVILVLALYYFLADHRTILSETSRLSPLDDEDDQQLQDSFVRVCRGVLLGNVLAALLQAVLNGLGFFIAGVEGVWILAVCTFVMSFIPFLGAASVWIFVVIVLLFEERFLAAGLLAVYGTVVVSSVDNFIRAYAIHDRSSIHPLVALISILGAIQLVGLWGIIIGPVAAGVFYALLDILSKRRSASEAADAEASDMATSSVR
jgi:predicted PurR-regulated permease PerM